MCCHVAPTWQLGMWCTWTVMLIHRFMIHVNSTTSDRHVHWSFTDVANPGSEARAAVNTGNVGELSKLYMLAMPIHTSFVRPSVLLHENCSATSSILATASPAGLSTSSFVHHCHIDEWHIICPAPTYLYKCWGPTESQVH